MTDPAKKRFTDPGAGPRLQFGMRGLFWLVTVMGVLFGVMTVIGPISSVGLTLLVLLVAAHVGGNAVGTRLSELTNRSLSHSPREEFPSQPHDSGRPQAQPPARLRQHVPINRLMLVVALTGAIAGATSGGILLSVMFWQQISLPGILLGSLSSGVLGALFGFLGSSCWSVTRLAWREASRVK